MPIIPYQQTTYETCLAVCLLHLIGQKPTSDQEIEIWKQGWNFNFLPGQLNFVLKKYKQNFQIFVQNKIYAQILAPQFNQQIKVDSISITSEWLKTKINEGPLILYIDNFYLQGTIHYPHFIVIAHQTPTMFTIIDSWDGKQKNINQLKIETSIRSLQRHLGFSPIAITLA